MDEHTACAISHVVSDERDDQHWVILKPQHSDELPGLELRIAIGAHEAQAMQRGLADTRFPRPLTHDLGLDCLNTLGIWLALLISREEDGVYYAHLLCEDRAQQQHQIDCRPSDGLALWTRQKNVPIWVATKLLKAR